MASGERQRSRVTQSHQILFIRTDRLGETLLNLPALAALKAAIPHALLTALLHPDLAPLLTGVSFIDQVMTDQHTSTTPWWRRAMHLARQLKARHFDVVVVSNPKKELHLAVWLACIPTRVGYDRKWGRLLTHRVPDRKALGERHEVEYNLDLVRALGLPVSASQWQLPHFDPEQAEVTQFLAQQGIQPTERFIAVHPWTSNPLKQWPVERYHHLIRRVREHLPVRLVVIGGPEERDHSAAVLADDLPAINLTGRLTLRQLVALLQRAVVLVSNDSGPVHVAAAAGTPTIVLFGTRDPATGPTRWGPWGVGHTVIWKPSMEAITIEEVFDAVRQYVT